ncbi:MAG: hypothetical protein R3B72_26220 [Polyangiaceae bacterium]
MTTEAIQATAKVRVARCELAPRDFIPLFHRWIQRDALPGVLVDVADYSHVHHGPGVMLVGHDAHWAMDERKGELGMFYKARRGTPRPAGEALREAVLQAAQAATLLEQDSGGKVTFAGQSWQVGFEDRLAAPNDAETFAALTPTLKTLAQELFGEAGGEVSSLGDPREPFRAALTGVGPLGVDEILRRLGGLARPAGLI